MCRKYYKPTAQEIKKLRELTGVNMLYCKKALECTGNIEDAIEYLKTISIDVLVGHHIDYFGRKDCEQR